MQLGTTFATTDVYDEKGPYLCLEVDGSFTPVTATGEGMPSQGLPEIVYDPAGKGYTLNLEDGAYRVVR